MNPHRSSPCRLVLASGSRYRKELLAKLGIPFHTFSPSIEETAQPGETPEQLSVRLAEEKARAVAERFPDHLIIGSDQVAMLGKNQLTKPGCHSKAVAQLQAASGQAVEFFTSVCLMNSATGESIFDIDRTVVHFRRLSELQIERYVSKERPFDCAGGFKSESLGIALFEKLETGDPNALVGLPLIKLIRLLEKSGVEIL